MRRRQQGIALLEALLAILILAIGLLGTIGLQARAYSALSDSAMRAEATLATEKLLGVMSCDQANLAAYAIASGGTPGARLAAWYNQTRSVIPGADIVITVTPTIGTTRSAVVARISWTRKTGGQLNSHQLTSYIAQSL
ncbi:MAG: prepilin-type N-terminal cleavage/methylation domain-containing protein [Pseudomonadota bacterium]